MQYQREVDAKVEQASNTKKNGDYDSDESQIVVPVDEDFQTPKNSDPSIHGTSREGQPQNGRNQTGNLSQSDVNQNANHTMGQKVIKQIVNAEKDQNERAYYGKFITQFSHDPNNAIQYLIDKGIIEDNTASIAKAILTTEGLSKDAINKFFCFDKQWNLEILEAFCRQLEIKGKDYLTALRILMSKFRLSGEAQQVDRIVEIFARVYHSENPNVFESEETPHVLAYSFIMLSTDAASKKISQRTKMTKQEFVKNNLPVFKDLPARYFEDVYDQLTREPFQTTVTYIEQMYNRMILCNEPLQGDQLKKSLQLAFDLMNGCNFIKYGRYGGAQPKKFFLSSDEKRICWRSINNETEPARYINVSDVYDLALGSNTTEIMRKNNVPQEFDMLCFSIITKSRTVDIQVNEIKIKSKWINYLRAVILTRRELEAKRAQQNLRRIESEQRREEIWKTDILPCWNNHWDYKKNKPENFKHYISVKKSEAVQKARNQANAGTMLASICSCLKKTILLQPIQNRQQIQLQNPILQQEPVNNSQVNDNFQIQQPNMKNKSLLLMILWKLGIPDFVRKTIWPIIIGNRLELSEQLFKILKSQASNVLNKNDENQWYTNSIKLFLEDIRQLRESFPILSQEKERQLKNVLMAFVFQRPDFGYIQGISILASILVKHLSEYDSFQAFVNLIHQYHFLPILMGDARQIEWRVGFFEENLERILPLVHQWLMALKVVTKVYLIRWFITIFANILPLQMLSRLWDNFLLEGEIYLFKVAISYIKYFQLELKMSNLDEVQRILTTRQENINEDYFFIQTDEIPIKEDEYEKFLQQQKAALINTQVHQSLLVA